MSLTPVYSEFDRSTGRWNWGLTLHDFNKVRAGYACPECLEDFHGIYLTVCPACGHRRDTDRDFLPTPNHFLPAKAAPAPEPM